MRLRAVNKKDGDARRAGGAARALQLNVCSRITLPRITENYSLAVGKVISSPEEAECIYTVFHLPTNTALGTVLPVASPRPTTQVENHAVSGVTRQHTQKQYRFSLSRLNTYRTLFMNK